MKSRALLRSEVRVILSGCDSTRDKAIITLASNTGFRASELCSLTIGQVALFKNGNFISIKDVIFQDTKGGKQRAVKLNSDAKKSLKGLVKGMIGRGFGENSPLFVAHKNGNGLIKSITRQRFWQIVKELAGKVLGEQRGISCHSFRKSFATRLYEKTKDILFVQACLGHSNVTTTQKYIQSSLGLFNDLDNLGFS